MADAGAVSLWTNRIACGLLAAATVVGLAIGPRFARSARLVGIWRNNRAGVVVFAPDPTFWMNTAKAVWGGRYFVQSSGLTLTSGKSGEGRETLTYTLENDRLLLWDGEELMEFQRMIGQGKNKKRS